MFSTPDVQTPAATRSTALAAERAIAPQGFERREVIWPTTREVFLGLFPRDERKDAE